MLAKSIVGSRRKSCVKTCDTINAFLWFKKRILEFFSCQKIFDYWPLISLILKRGSDVKRSVWTWKDCLQVALLAVIIVAAGIFINTSQYRYFSVVNPRVFYDRFVQKILNKPFGFNNQDSSKPVLFAYFFAWKRQIYLTLLEGFTLFFHFEHR